MIHEHKQKVTCFQPATKYLSSQSSGGHRNVWHWVKPWSINLQTHWTKIGSNIENIAQYIVKLQLVSCNPKNNTISFSLQSLDNGGLSNQFTIHRYDSYENLISHHILKYSSDL